MSEREANETAEHGEVLRWSTDSGEDEYPQVTVETVEQTMTDSEEPTEFGVVWERFVIKETQDVLGLHSTGGLEITTRNEDCVGIRSVTAESPSAVTKCTTKEESPILSEYESDGFLSRRKTLSKRAQAKLGIFQRAKKLTPSKEVHESDSDDDEVPLVSLLATVSSNVVSDPPPTKEPNGSDAEDDDVPLVALVATASSKIVAVPPPDVVLPQGEACIGIHVARDFGGDLGIFKGSIVRVDLNRRRPLYHVVYDDGDEEDYDIEELRVAVKLHEAINNGLPFNTQSIPDQGNFPTVPLSTLKILLLCVITHCRK